MFLHMREAAADFCAIVERNKDRWVTECCGFQNHFCYLKFVTDFIFSFFIWGFDCGYLASKINLSAQKKKREIIIATGYNVQKIYFRG